MALGASSQFYWHTNTQNVEMLSKVVLDKDIEENGYENVEMPMDVSVCFVFNKLMNAYRTCSSEEDKRQAQPEGQQLNQAHQTPIR